MEVKYRVFTDLVAQQQNTFDIAAELMLPFILRYNDLHDSARYFQMAARIIGSLLYDLPHIKTGYISLRAFEEVNSGRLKRANLCNEHFISRQRAGRELLTTSRLTFESLRDRLVKYCHVHQVLSQENQALERVQTSQKYDSWIDEYKAAGVDLRRDIKKIFVVDGNIYSSHAEIAKAYNISVATVSSRITSGFKGWNLQKQEIEV